MSALDELLSRWRSNPDADATVALCSELGRSSREDLVREASASASAWHADDWLVMLAVGRMNLDAGYLAEAQAALVAAGRANGREAKSFRYLGEVLLRRGDALRAEKVLARAVQLAADDAEARVWYDRSVVYSVLQKQVGVEAVANEVLRATHTRSSAQMPPGAALARRSFAKEGVLAPAADSAALARVPFDQGSELPRFESEETVTSPGRREASATRPSALGRPARATTIGMGPPGPKLASAALNSSGPRTVRPIAPSARERPAPKRASEPARFDDVVTTVTRSPVLAAPSAESAPESARPPFPKPRKSLLPAPPPPPPLILGAPASLRAIESLLPAPPPPPPPILGAPASLRAVEIPESNAFELTPRANSKSRSLASAAPEAVSMATRAHEVSSPATIGTAQPDVGLVLEHLSRVGVFEPGGGAPPAWEKPAHQKTRGTWMLALSIALLAAAGAGSYAYSLKIRGERLQRAASLNDEVKRSLETGSVSALRQTDQKLNASFELDSLSPRAARLWLQNRVLYALLTGDEARGIDAAVHRAKTVGLPDKDTAFGKIAAFMTEGDLAGGAAILARWDSDSAGDPYYQLVAGAVLERAGDLRAADRYEVARKLDPDFVPAQMLLARLLLLEFGGERAKEVLASLRAKLGSAPITRALSALSWVVDPERSEALPEDAKLEASDLALLPAPLSGVPAMVEAVKEMRAGDGAKASRAIDSAVTGAMTPSLATGLGFLAIEVGDEQLARKAALRALQFTAAYPRARTLAARVALLGERLDEAQKAIEGLDPASSDVVLVRGVFAYESSEASDLTDALRALGEAARTRRAYSALAAGPDLLAGHAFPATSRIEAMASPATTWGELIAADAALDLGNLALANKVLAGRQGRAVQPARYLRLARLYRYQKEIDASLRAAAAAAGGSMTANVLLEWVYALLSKKDEEGARDMVAKHASVLGAFSPWLAVLLNADGKQKAQALARAAKLVLPPVQTPLTLRILVARALAVSGDKRGRPYVLALAKQAPKHPDVIEAALALK